MTRAEGGSREKPQLRVSLCLYAKGDSSCQHLGLEEVPTVLYVIHCFQFITTPISWFLLLSITKWKKLYPRFIEIPCVTAALVMRNIPEKLTIYAIK